MAKWVVQAKRADFREIGQKFHIDPVIARIIRNREIIGDKQIQSYLHPLLQDLYNPYLLKDADRAAELIEQAIAEHKKIRVIGDYDVDGIQSTFILITALKRCNAIVDYAIPHRIEDGYGINPSMVEAAIGDNIEMIITCDNGIAAMEAISLAKKHGLTVIITDHHDIPYEGEKEEKQYVIPPADAVVNPKQEQCQYPFAGICGAVVAWKLVQVLYERMQKDSSEAMVFLENAAFATVGDVMELQDENRIIVKYGLEALQKTKNPGMQALIQQANITKEQITAYHIGFVLGPCLNASGRLDTAEKAIQLLEDTNVLEASAKAEALYNLNEERKTMTLQGVEEAMAEIEKKRYEKDKVLVIYLPSLHESLAGIIAGRVKERFNKPTFVITNCEEGAKGSGRSIEGYSMYEELHKCQELFTKYGGHPMAAGISLPIDNISILREKLNENIILTDEEMESKIVIDVPMTLDYLSNRVIDELQLLEPFGNGNSKPVFADKDIYVRRIQYIGKNKNFLKLVLETKGHTQMDALYFGDVIEFQQFVEETFSKEDFEQALHGKNNNIVISITYYPQLNTYNNQTSIQLVISNYC